MAPPSKVGSLPVSGLLTHNLDIGTLTLKGKIMMDWKHRGRIYGLCGALALMLGTAGPLGSAMAATITIQRTTIYINTLPKGCVMTTYNNGNVIVWKCGTLYYQPYKGRYVRVYIIT